MLSSRPIHINVEHMDARALAPAKGLATGSKTPGRAILKSRAALRENAVGPHTVHRVVLNNKHTPFRSKTHQSSNKPLLDKTPFHNRQNPLSTPAPQTFKIAKLAYNDNNPEQLNAPLPGSALLRPSSLRKSLRGRLSGDDKGLKPMAFKTPVSQGRHWDVSDVSIEVPTEVELNELIVEEDFDEIEYMPPRQPEQPYNPPFDFAIPDYKELGLNLRSLAQSYKFDDEVELLQAREVEFSEQGFSKMPKIQLAPLGDEDDPFFINRPIPKASMAKATLAPKTVPSQSKSTPVVPTRKPSTTTRSTMTTVPRPNTTVPRSGGLSTRPVQPMTRPVSTVPRTQPRSTSLAIRPASTIPRSTSTLTARPITRYKPAVSAFQKPNSSGLTKRGGSAATSSVKPITSLKKSDLSLVFDVGVDLDDFRFDV